MTIPAKYLRGALATNGFANLEVGETVHVNHDECPAGEDTRKRLYITRTVSDPTFHIAYCHNCAQHGYFRKHDGITPSSYRFDAEEHYPITQTKIYIPRTATSDPTCWPRACLAYFDQYNIALKQLIDNRIAYDPSDNTIIFPVYSDYLDDSKDLVLLGYQKRYINYVSYNYKYPKYTTVKLQEVTNLYKLFTQVSPINKTILILVEDFISGMKVHDATGLDVMAMFGCNISTELLYKVSKDYDTVMLWLDNDGDMVETHRQEIVRKINVLGKGVYSVTDPGDPKSYTRQDIRNKFPPRIAKEFII